MTLPVLPKDGISLILYGDVPLVRQTTLEQLIEVSNKTGIGMITLHVDNPTGYGRIVRQDGKIQAIVEHKDATEAQRQIQEINTGIYCVSNAKLHEWLPKLSNENAQGEYYLTDIVAMAVADGLEIASIQPELAFEVEGVNDRLQLAALEREFQKQQAKELMQQGVTFADPARFDLRGTVKVGHDVRIDVNVIIEGDCELGDFVEIGAGCILKIQPLQRALKSKRTAFLMEQLLGKIPKLVLSHAYVQVLNWQTKYISATLLKSKIQRSV